MARPLQLRIICWPLLPPSGTSGYQLKQRVEIGVLGYQRFLTFFPSLSKSKWLRATLPFYISIIDSPPEINVTSFTILHTYTAEQTLI